MLSLFGTKTKAVRQGYHQFVVDGMKMGKRPELMGGGLRRSQVLNKTSDEIMDFDDRILGSGEFVTELRSKGLLTDERPTAVNLTQLQQIIEGRYQLDKDGIMQRGRMNNISEARCVFCFYAVRQLHHPAVGIPVILKSAPLLFRVRYEKVKSSSKGIKS